MVKVKCGWCREIINIDNSIGKNGFGCKTCLNCGRIIPSSKKEFTGSFVGRKHFHSPWKTGDIV